MDLALNNLQRLMCHKPNQMTKHLMKCATSLLNHQKINQLMYMNDMKLFEQKENALENQIQTVGVTESVFGTRQFLDWNKGGIGHNIGTWIKY